MTNPAADSADDSADYEDLPTGTLRDQIRSLSADELQHLIDGERQRDDRAAVIEVLESRLAQLRGETG